MNIIDLSNEKGISLVFEDDDHWHPFEKKEEFLPLINPIDYEHETNLRTTNVKARPVSFYTDCKILKVQDKRWQPEGVTFYFLCSGEEYFQVSSQAETLESLNASLVLNLKKHNVVDYLKFVLFFFRPDPEYGANCLIEGKYSEFADFLPYSNLLEQKRNLEKLSAPIVNSTEPQGSFEVECDAMLALDLVRAKFKVLRDGGIEFKEGKIIIPGHYPNFPEEELPKNPGEGES